MVLVLPGAAYAYWRHRGGRPVCRRCGSYSVLPEEAPVARQIMASVPVLPAQALPPGEQAMNALRWAPVAAGITFVLLFALSSTVPGVRGSRWLLIALYLAGVVIVAHPLWAAIHLVSRAAGTRRPPSLWLVPERVGR